MSSDYNQCERTIEHVANKCGKMCDNCRHPKEKVEVQEIAPFFSLTDKPEDLWYQQEEYSSIYKRIRQLAKYSEANDGVEVESPSPKKKVCTRGLEWIIDGRSTRLQEARECVFAAQKLQFDDEGMALAYESVTRKSAVIAQERASNDANAIKLYIRR